MTLNTNKEAAGAINTNGTQTDTDGVESPVAGASVQAASTDLSLTITATEVRIDSRLLAEGFGNKHKATMALIERYSDRFKALGLLPFKKEVIKGRGQPKRYALLNEDQSYFLLSLSRNTDSVVVLKSKLIAAFGDARRAVEMRRTEYLPSYHELQDVIHRKAIESTNEKMVHINVAKLVNQTVGIEAGQRRLAPVPKQAMLIVAQSIAARAMNSGSNHRDGYQLVKQSMHALKSLAMPELATKTST